MQKYGKIKQTSNISNIYGTAAQIIIHMKKLIEGQFENFQNNPDSEIIPALIDVYQQMNDEQEYLDINPFIHSMKKYNFEYSNFANFFSCILEKIDFTKGNGIDNFQIPICFTALDQNEEVKKSFIFDIPIKADIEDFTKLIPKECKFSSNAFKKPNFLFFHPINDKKEEITISNKKLNMNDKFDYTLSIIVVKENQIQHDNLILYIFCKNWFQFKKENIILIDNAEEYIFKKIKDQKKYTIELCGYCQNTRYIIPIQVKDAKASIKEYDLNEFRILPYQVSFVDFDSIPFSRKLISPKIFYNLNERNEYLKSLKEEDTSKRLLYDIGDSKLSYEINFDDEELYDITVYSTDDLESDDLNPIQVLFCEYHRNLRTVDEVKINSKRAFFESTSTIKELFESSRYLESGSTSLYLIDNSKDPPYQKLNDDDDDFISTLSETTNNIFICYIPNSMESIFDEKKLVFGDH